MEESRFSGFALLSLCVGGCFFASPSLGKMLREEAQNTSSEWVSMLVARHPDILTLFSDATPSVQTRHLLDEATQVGDIYRFRLWDMSGNLVYKSERLKSDGAPIAFSESE